MVYGGSSDHSDCFYNSLHELNTINLEWTVLAPSEAEGAPMKKDSCGIVVYSSGGEEQLCVFGGFGLLNSASHPTAQYEEGPQDRRGYTNELHIFTSGEHMHTHVHTHTHTHTHTHCSISLHSMVHVTGTDMYNVQYMYTVHTV